MMDATAGNDVIRTGQIEIRFRLQAAQTAGRMTMFEFLVPAGARVPVPHSHDAFDETVYGLAGVTTWMLDGEAVRVGPGDVLFIPRGHVHHFANLDTEDARELSVIVPVLGPEYSARSPRSSMQPGRPTSNGSWRSCDGMVSVQPRR